MPGTTKGRLHEEYNEHNKKADYIILSVLFDVIKLHCIASVARNGRKQGCFFP